MSDQAPWRAEMNASDAPPITEPIVVPDLFVNGVHVTRESDCARFCRMGFDGKRRGRNRRA
jgi:hypothetical protein